MIFALVKKLNSIHKISLLTVCGLLVIISLLSDSILFMRLIVFMMAILCVLLGLREKVLINPYMLFLLTPLTLSCYYSISDWYMPEISIKTWKLCVINIYAFILALSFIPEKWKKQDCLLKKTEIRRHFYIMSVLYLLIFIVPPLSGILWLFCIGAVVCAMMTKSLRLIGIVIILIILRFVGGGASKMELVMFLLTFALCYIKFYNYKKNFKKKLLIGFVAALFILIASFQFATKGQGRTDAEDVFAEYSSRVDWNYSAILFLPYMYLETAWGNVEYVVKTQDTRSNGLWTIKPFLGYIGLASNFEHDYYLEANSSFNTFTFITVCFKDFGLWFSIIPTLILGFFVKIVYLRYLNSNAPFETATYALTGLATFEMFFSNHFYMQSYPFTMFFLMEIYKMFFFRNIKVKQRL